MNAPTVDPRPLVLVIDDDPTVRVLMRSQLRKAGFAAALAATGAEGLRLFDERPAQMVMLDVDLPDTSGLEVCRRLRSRAGDLLPIVMVTGMDDVEAVTASYEAGATDFIAKPIPWMLFGHRAQYLHRSSRAMIELAVLHARNNAVLGAIPDLLLRVDADGRILEVRDGGVADAGVVPTAGRSLPECYPAEAAQRLSVGLQAALARGGVQDLAFVVPRADGRRGHHEARVSRIDDREALCLVRDITARAQTQAALARSEHKLAQAQALAGMGSWYVDFRSGVFDCSAQARRLLGVDPLAAVDAEAFFARVHEDDLADVRAIRTTAIERVQPYSCEFRIRIGDRVAWLQEHADIELDDRGEASGIYGTVQDITERKEAEGRIARLAYVDSLTGLPNRAAFMERLQREVRRAHGRGRRFALLFMDLDGFKAVNDALGHLAGDRLLQVAADRLRAELRPGDLVARPEGRAEPELARLGGDEFTALVLDVNTPEDVLPIAYRVLAALRRPFDADGRALSLSCSLGIAVYPDDGTDGPALLKHADTAMYHAKEKGRDNCQFYSAALTARAVERMALHNDLRLAVERGQFHLVFQPLVAVGSRQVTAVEALLRWDHPERGAVPPGDFIAVAESTGLIVSIGQWVLEHACATVAGWRREGLELPLAINLSPVQLRDPHLVEIVRDTLQRTGLPAASLELEVTEGALMDDGAATRAALQGLQRLGVRLALDDFGTGYSSMGYLKRMPVHALKIDRSFVQGLPGDRDSEAIVRAIVSIARSLDFEVTAEGVETEAQAQALAQLGCDRLQGFHFGRPVAAAAMFQRLADEQARPPMPEAIAATAQAPRHLLRIAR